ncbi:PatB family C-S lyase [Odoribacter sp. OttesenSCG-928-L07]|nr:PatB family C-S lyase [Odoribacter sp. OttesenSCG-928-L07]MDL2239594.1 PatB family C-S lyase [Bacteroidales bacterium OttesenSCG-928-L14]MDL2241245.1 PatB family C-S lyase [Bacteroidales bacterium OttesenSCG-928-K22]
MRYNFDEIIDRSGTHNVKHDLAPKVFGTNDIIPMWVADMDFRTPDFIVDALKERCNHELFGYTFAYDGYISTVLSWLEKRYDLPATKENIHFIPGIVAGISFCIQAFTNEDDKILIQTPVYPPFINLPKNNNRQLVTSKLKIENGRFAIDFVDFIEKIKGCKMMILCNPHNPGGTAWSEEDLQRIARICHKNNVLVISDEIHADLILPQHKHHSFASVSQEAKDCSITFMAPSKTFNIAGLSSSIACVFNDNIREKFFGYLNGYEIANGNIFAFVACEAAFKNGENWLFQLTSYLQNNCDYLKNFTENHLPMLKVIIPEASYLAWIDFNALGMAHNDLKKFLIHEAKVGLNSGTDFGDDYEGFMRMNIGCPLSVLKTALDNIKTAINNLD